MGSVGVDHRCPRCGRTGNGGYSLDFATYSTVSSELLHKFDKEYTGPNKWRSLWKDMQSDTWTDAKRRHALAFQLLHSTKEAWQSHRAQFEADLRAIPKVTDEDFKAFQAKLRQEAVAQDMPAPIADVLENMPELQKLRQHMMMHTSNACFTEGQKMAERYEGDAMNIHRSIANTESSEPN